MLLNLIDKNCVGVLLFLAISPGSKYNRKEIKEKIGMHNAPLDITLKKLVFFNMIKENKRIYLLNLENSIVKEILKERGKISNLPLKIQMILLELINALSKFKRIKKVILFGSYAKLIFTEKSDIDIAIIVEKNTNLEKEINAIVKKIFKKNKKQIQIHFFEESDMKNKSDPLIKDILRNGRGLLY